VQLRAVPPVSSHLLQLTFLKEEEEEEAIHHNNNRDGEVHPLREDTPSPTWHRPTSPTSARRRPTRRPAADTERRCSRWECNLPGPDTFDTVRLWDTPPLLASEVEDRLLKE